MFKIIAKVFTVNDSEIGSRVELSNGETNLEGVVSHVSENEFVVDWADGARSVENKSDYQLIVNSKRVHSVDDDHANCTATGAKACPVVVQRRRDAAHAENGHDWTCGYAWPEFGEKALPMCEALQAEKEAHDKAHGITPPTASVIAAENPAQPAGWAVAPVDADAYPGGELIAIEMEKRNETAGWEDAQNRDPIDGENPAQPAGFAVPPASGGPISGQGASGLIMSAKVYADDEDGTDGYAEVISGDVRIAGRVLASDDDNFIVEWQDTRRTVENKSDYELILPAEITDTVSDSN